jgi:NADH:ubiquinone oxidoreductase subunit 2 (subunit N)
MQLWLPRRFWIHWCTIITYATNAFGVFLVVNILKNICGKPVIYVTDLYVSQNNLFIQGALSIIIFSFAGIPPFLGFFNKYTVICALYNKSYIFLCSIVIVAAIIAAYYYLRILCFVSLKNGCIKAGNKNPLLFATKLIGQIVSNIKSTGFSYLLFVLIFYIFFLPLFYTSLIDVCFLLQITGIK